MNTTSQPKKDAIRSCAPVAGSVIEQRNRIGCIFVEDDGAQGDNLAIALASYFSDHMDRPEDDPDDTDTGWGEWVIAKTNRALDRIAEVTSQNAQAEPR